MNADITRGVRVKVKQTYGTVTFVGPGGTVWYRPDDVQNEYAVRPQYGEKIERVHGNKHKPKSVGWPV